MRPQSDACKTLHLSYIVSIVKRGFSLFRIGAGTRRVPIAYVPVAMCVPAGKGSPYVHGHPLQ